MNSSDPFLNSIADNEEEPTKMTTTNTARGTQDTPVPSGFPPSSIHIVTWYMSDSLSFTTLVNLLMKHVQYDQVRKLELVLPNGGDLKGELVDALCDYIESNKYLRDVHLYSVKPKDQRSAVSDKLQQAYMKQIETACGHNVDCSHQTVPTGDPHPLCESLTNTIHENVYRRHLAVDGLLLQGISKSNLTQLAFDISWDRSIHVCVLKDLPNTSLKAILPKLVHPPLQCLKIVNDPALAASRKLPEAPHFNTLPLQYMLKSPKLKHLQRLYFGHVRFSPSNLPPLLDTIQTNWNQLPLQELEFVLCQFDKGTGKLFQEFRRQQQQCGPHLSLRFDYPVLTSVQEEEDSFLMSSLGSVFTIGSTSSLMRGEPQTPLQSMKPSVTQTTTAKQQMY